MGVELDVWIETVKKHPAKYRFRGLSGWHTDVREAAVRDERFMDQWMENEQKGLIEDLEMALKLPPPKDGEDGPSVESYAQFLRGKFWDKWDEPENMNKAPARKIIDKLEPKKPIRRKFYPDISKDSLRLEWASETCDPEVSWDEIRHMEPEILLKDHPPTYMLDQASGIAVPVEDVYFICPGCDQQPITKEQVVNDDFHCGLCGAGNAMAGSLPFEKFVEEMGIKLWPFRRSNGT